MKSLIQVNNLDSMRRLDIKGKERKRTSSEQDVHRMLTIARAY